MRRILLLLSALALPLLVFGNEKPILSKIFEIWEVNIKELKTDPSQLAVEAIGEVNSGGWKNPALVPSNPPSKDGVYHYDFVAERPSGIVTRNMERVVASLRIAPKPADLKGIVIHTQTNTKEVGVEK